MELLEAILSRRTIKDFTPGPVPGEVLDRALAAGLWAQNHRLTQPWRFTVLGPETQQALAEAAADAQLESMQLSDDTDFAMRDILWAGARRKILAKPLIVAVTFCLSADAQQRREDYAATCCAIQNIQLAAWAEGLGMQWSTNKMTRRRETYALLQIDPVAEEFAGLLYFGYPAEVPAPRPRKPLSEVLRRLP